MSPGPMRRAIAAVALLARLPLGCEHRVTAYPTQPRMTDAGAVRFTYVVVNWVASVDGIAAECNTHGDTWYACAKVKVRGDVSDCTVWAFRPKDFNDQVRLAILGHEFLHCLGALH